MDHYCHYFYHGYIHPKGKSRDVKFISGVIKVKVNKPGERDPEGAWAGIIREWSIQEECEPEQIELTRMNIV